MQFAHDAVLSMRFTASIVALPLDTLTRDEAHAALRELVRDQPFTGPITHDDRELAELTLVRRRLVALWDADRDDAVEIVNELLRSANAVPQLVRHGELDWHIHAVEDERPFAERIAVDAAVAMLDYIRTGETSRRKRCAADGCGRPFLDESRNRSRRFCSLSCQNRTNVAAFRARAREAQDS